MKSDYSELPVFRYIRHGEQKIELTSSHIFINYESFQALVPIEHLIELLEKDFKETTDFSISSNIDEID